MIKYSKDIEESMARIKREDAEDAPYRNAKLSNWKPEALEPTFRDGVERKTPKEPIDRDKLNSIIDDLNKTDDQDMNVPNIRYRLLKDLPTFKAGGTFHLNAKGNLVSDNEFSKGIVAYARSTLAKFPNILTDWFEEIKAEPLIKDEKVRKAVRAWADVLEIDEAEFYGAGTWIGFRSRDSRTGCSSKFEVDCFGSDNTLVPFRRYTIAELCGEEEE